MSTATEQSIAAEAFVPAEPRCKACGAEEFNLTDSLCVECYYDELALFDITLEALAALAGL